MKPLRVQDAPNRRAHWLNLLTDGAVMNIDYYELRRGFYAVLPLYLGFIPLSLILGTQAYQHGQSPLTAYLMTCLNIAGGSEFAAVSLWSATPPVLLIILTTFLINSRHIIMGATLAPYIKNESGLRIAFIYFFLIDECWALTMQDIQRRSEQKLGFSFWFHIGAGFGLWAMWTTSTCMGAIIASMGSQVGDLNKLGFAIALPATFIWLSIGMRPRTDFSRYIPIALSFIAACLTTVFIDRIYAVGAGAVMGLVSAYVLQVVTEKRKEQDTKSELQTEAAAKQGAELAPSKVEVKVEVKE